MGTFGKFALGFFRDRISLVWHPSGLKRRQADRRGGENTQSFATAACGDVKKGIGDGAAVRRVAIAEPRLPCATIKRPVGGEEPGTNGVICF